jgi:hypothetical protein
MRALFIGGTVDNSELDLAPGDAPQRYPATGTGQGRYRLHHFGLKDDEPVYAVYASPELGDAHVMQVVLERDYARRFAATSEAPGR